MTPSYYSLSLLFHFLLSCIFLLLSLCLLVFKNIQYFPCILNFSIVPIYLYIFVHILPQCIFMYVSLKRTYKHKFTCCCEIFKIYNFLHSSTFLKYLFYSKRGSFFYIYFNMKHFVIDFLFYSTEWFKNKTRSTEVLNFRN